MDLPSDPFYGALIGIGHDEPIPRDVLDQMARWGILEIQADGTPTLTDYGKRCFSLVKSGAFDITEFNALDPPLPHD
jgi:hypothetical protein